MEASAKGAASATDPAPTAGSVEGDPLAPSNPDGAAGGGTGSGGTGSGAKGSGAKSDGAGGSTSKSGGSKAGAIMRIDPNEPSRPQASSSEENVVYVTQHGRAVKAGGGIAPDVTVEARQLGELERSLLQRGIFFQFAGEYLQKHAAPIDVRLVHFGSLCAGRGL